MKPMATPKIKPSLETVSRLIMAATDGRARSRAVLAAMKHGYTSAMTDKEIARIRKEGGAKKKDHP